MLQGLNTYFVLGEGFLVFMMQLGLALVFPTTFATAQCLMNLCEL